MKTTIPPILSSFHFSCWLAFFWATSPAAGYYGTTTFDSILVAHPAPTICPPSSGFDSYLPDASYIACCNHWFGTHTLTSGTGPGGGAVYACCKSGYTCTAPVSLMKDWTIDSNKDLQTFDLANAPTPTPAAAGATGPITAAPTRSTGTVSSPGATPIATGADGVVVYVYNGDNTQTVTVGGGDGGGGLSAGAIAGISLACTVVMAVMAVLGVKWAKRQAKATEREKSSQPPGSSGGAATAAMSNDKPGGGGGGYYEQPAVVPQVPQVPPSTSSTAWSSPQYYYTSPPSVGATSAWSDNTRAYSPWQQQQQQPPPPPPQQQAELYGQYYAPNQR